MDGLGSMLSPEAGVTRDEMHESSDDGACLLEASSPRRNAVRIFDVVTQASAAQLCAVCSSHVRVVENLWCGRTQAGEVWAANEAHAVHRNNDPGLVWHWAAAGSRWWLLRSRMDPSASPY